MSAAIEKKRWGLAGGGVKGETRVGTVDAESEGRYLTRAISWLFLPAPFYFLRPRLPLMLDYLAELSAHVEYIHSFGFVPRW